MQFERAHHPKRVTPIAHKLQGRKVGPGLKQALRQLAVPHGLRIHRREAKIAPQNAKIAIIGAGMAGLFTGYLLDICGVPYEIFEATERVGGRVHTYQFPNNPDGEQYGDLGAMRIPPTHIHLLELIKILGLDKNLIPYVLENPNALFYVNQQQVMTVQESEEPLSQNVLGYAYLKIEGAPPQKPPPPGAPIVTLAPKAPQNPGILTEAGGVFSSIPTLFNTINDALQDDFIKMNTNFVDFVLKYDQYTVQEWFSAQTKILYEKYFAPNDEALRVLTQSLLDYIEVCVTATGENQLGLVDFCSDGWDFEADPEKWHTLNGGLGQIPDTLAKTIKGPIHTQHRITKMENVDGKGVKLTYHRSVFGPAETTDYFTSVICTAPAHLVRFIEMTPAFSYEKFQAIRKLNYDHSTKVFLQYESRFWDKLLNPVPPVHAAGVKTAHTQTTHGHSVPQQLTASGTSVGKGGTTSTDLPVFKVVYPSYGNNPKLAVLLGSYTWTNDAVLMANMDESERIALIQQNLKFLHGPENVPAPVAAKVQLWQQAYALFFAGQYRNDYWPMFRPEQNVYFAGEHLSAHHAWIVGAMYSAADAVALWMHQNVGTVPPKVLYWAHESPWFDGKSANVTFVDSSSG